jgi:Glycosyltransferase like family 2
MTGPAPRDDFFSGTSGQVWGIRATTRAVLADAICDAAALATLVPWRVARAARRWPRRRVLALAVERTDVPNVLAQARAELQRSRHEVTFVAGAAGNRGKFENLNHLLSEHPAAGHDWLLIIDDDVVLPRGFLDAFVFLAERFDFALAQPAHRWRSHAAWRVTRRCPGALARQTRFVEIGPVCGLRAATFGALLPFPELQFGWGLDLHWSAVAQARGWREGVVDATPIRHGLRRIASSYDRSDAVAETRSFLAARPYTPALDAQRSVATHRRWR